MATRTPSRELVPAWRVLARWAIPIMMTCSYCFLAYAADTTSAAKGWMFGGLFFVLVLWFIFRRITAEASLARALAVGDTQSLRMLVDEQLARRQSREVRARFLVYRGLAHELDGDWSGVEAALDEAGDPGDARLARLAAAARVAAFVETGDAARAREVFEAELAASRAVIGGPRDLGGPTDLIVRLAEGRLAFAEHAGELATSLLARIVDDVRAGSAMRATAHRYLARLAADRGDREAAARHTAAAAKLAQNEPVTASPS